MAMSVQIPLPPTPVVSVYPRQAPQVVTVNLLAIVRFALVRAALSQDWLASVFGCSKQAIQAALSDSPDCETKHLSMRKLSRVQEPVFWRSVMEGIAEALGLEIIVCTPEQRQAVRDVVSASARLTAQCAPYAELR